ncbi:MAG: hypothetical protein M1823_004156 [Watsoniomyces obsoletus]|nr:MAG: hypothetical protein M1823_004156 [Watsoniomyces obsoletus]
MSTNDVEMHDAPPEASIILNAEVTLGMSETPVADNGLAASEKLAREMAADQDQGLRRSGRERKRPSLFIEEDFESSKTARPTKASKVSKKIATEQEEEQEQDEAEPDVTLSDENGTDGDDKKKKKKQPKGKTGGTPKGKGKGKGNGKAKSKATSKAKNKGDNEIGNLDGAGEMMLTTEPEATENPGPLPSPPNSFEHEEHQDMPDQVGETSAGGPVQSSHTNDNPVPEPSAETLGAVAADINTTDINTTSEELGEEAEITTNDGDTGSVYQDDAGQATTKKTKIKITFKHMNGAVHDPTSDATQSEDPQHEPVTTDTLDDPASSPLSVMPDEEDMHNESEGTHHHGQRSHSNSLPPPGQTWISLANMDERSFPLPGPKLLAKVERAKRDGRIRADYDSAVVRCTRRDFLVPEKCQACVESNVFCDRGSPCSSCRLSNKPCCRDPHVTRMVKATPKAVFTFSGLLSPHKSVKKNNVMDHHNDQRPAARGEPQVWAESRQALCEALPYYRAFQSGAYVTRGYCYGLMADKQAGERDFINEHIVIARAGGGMAKVDGEMSQVADQTSDSSVVTAMMHNMKDEVPLVLILGRDNPKAPARISHRYGVLGHFHLTRIWCEKAGAKNTYMYRFEKINLAEESWWAPPGPSALPPGPVGSTDPTLATCLYCEHTCEQIYTECWMCLNEHCPLFWTIDLAPPKGPLVYTEAFINERRGWPSHLRAPFPLRPPLPTSDDRDPSSAVSRGAWKGIVCPQCGRCNSRVEWRQWRCETTGCGFVYTVPFDPFSYRSVAGSFDMFFEGHAVPTAKMLGHVEESHQFVGNYRINQYHLPGCGWVSHIQVNRPISTRPGGPDDMFVQLQQEDLGLKRFPLGNSTMPGGLTAHFAVNFGMPYKYIVAVDSKPFSEAPDLILNVLHRLQWAANQTHAADDGPFGGFNELLAVGYLEEQKMGYHDDGEPGLGPTVASLSLGADATMSWRMKKTPYWGISKGGVLRLEECPVAGCQHYEERQQYFDGDEEMSREDREDLEEKVRGSQSQRNAPVALSITLRHGDIMVMHGADIQKYYEHGVQPHGKLRYALTCRYIDPRGIPENQRWKASYDQARFPPYLGDPAMPESQLAVPSHPFAAEPTESLAPVAIAGPILGPSQGVVVAAPLPMPIQPGLDHVPSGPGNPFEGNPSALQALAGPLHDSSSGIVPVAGGDHQLGNAFPFGATTTFLASGYESAFAPSPASGPGLTNGHTESSTFPLAFPGGALLPVPGYHESSAGLQNGVVSNGPFQQMLAEPINGISDGLGNGQSNTGVYTGMSNSQINTGVYTTSMELAGVHQGTMNEGGMMNGLSGANGENPPNGEGENWQNNDNTDQMSF